MKRLRECGGVAGAFLLGTACGLGGMVYSDTLMAPVPPLVTWEEVAAGLPPLDWARNSEYGYETYAECLDRLSRLRKLAASRDQLRDAIDASSMRIVWFVALPLGLIGAVPLLVWLGSFMPNGGRGGTP